MSNTKDQLTAAREAVHTTPLHHQCVYTNVMALRAVYAEQEPHFRFVLTTHPAPTPLDIMNGVGHVFNYVRGDNEFLNIRFALEYSEASPEFKEANAIIQPLVDEVRRLEAKLEAESVAYFEKVTTARQAEDAALEEARRKVESDPEIAKLRAHAEKIRPAHIEESYTPFRGKVILTTAPAGEAATA